MTKTTDLIERFHCWAENRAVCGQIGFEKDLTEAATEIERLYTLAKANNDLARMHAKTIERLTSENMRLREALEPFASVADLIEAETEGFDDSDEIELIYHDYLFDRFTVHQFKDARKALAENR